MKKRSVIVFAVILTMLFSMAQFGMGMAVLAAEESAAMLFVAPNGSDQNDGSIEKPFVTLEAARDAARKINGKVVVNLREGTYPVSNTLELGEQDSNTTFRAYMDEEVVLNAANELKASDFAKVTDQAVKDRIVDKDAKDKVMQADLKALGITEYGKIKCIGMGTYPDAGFSPALYFNDQMMTIARYPNDKYLDIAKVVNEGTIISVSGMGSTGASDLKGFEIQVNDKRLDSWKNANEIWMFGYFKHDWAEAHIAATIDFENNNTIKSAYPSNYGVATGQRLYFYNLLEEIDQEGEWYLDRESGILYMIPLETMNADSVIEFVTYDKPFVKLDGADNVQIKGIQFEKSIGTGIEANNVENLVIADCEFSSISDAVIQINEGKDCDVVNNYIHDVGASGINLSGGDRTTLTPGNNVAENNKIERFSRIKTTYAPGISLQGVGNRASHNEINDAPHFAMSYGGNDQIIEYNNIYDVCKDTADSGAIYTGRDWSTWGHEIRFNYFHDLKMIDTKTGMEMQAIYLDDMHSQTKVYGNVFYKVDSVALYGGGRNNTFENNLMLECAKPFTMDSRGTGWAASTDWLNPKSDASLYKKLEKFPYKEGIWNEKYPELANILEDEPILPKHNVIKNNVEYRSAGYNLDANVTKYGTVENNIELKKTDSFADYKNKDFTVKADSEIKEKIPDFIDIPFNEIGLRTRDVEEVQKNSVMLFIGSPRAVALGNKTLVDPANLAVAPIVKDDRTLVPVRFIAESFGAKVGWDEATQTVTVEGSGKTITLVIDSAEMNVDGQTVMLDVPAQTINDRTLIPLRAIVEVMGKQVFWDEKGLIVMSDQKDLVAEEDTFLIDSLIRSITVE